MHRQIQQQLAELQQNAEFVKYAAYAFGLNGEIPNDIRQLAGLLLKNAIKTHPSSLDAETIVYIKNTIFPSIADPKRFIRNTTGSIITTLVKSAGLGNWPELPGALARLLESGDAGTVDGAFSTLEKLCEDNAPQLDSEETGRPLNALFPIFIKLFGHPTARVRQYSVQCVLHVIRLTPAALDVNIEALLAGLSALTADPDSDVRRLVCASLVVLVDCRLEVLMPHMPSVTEFMLACMADPHELVAQEACEFWSVFCDVAGECVDALRAYFPRLFPLLLQRMCFTEEQLADMGVSRTGQDVADASVPDKPEDIRPIFHKASAVMTFGAGGGGQAVAAGAAAGAGDDDSDDDDDDDDDDSEWSLRKAAAASLDQLSVTFTDAILPHLLPVLEQCFGDPNWLAQEAAVLALGAVADGCGEGLLAHLPTLFPFLMSLLQSPRPLVRCITCWTATRYSAWVAEQPSESHFTPLMQQLLTRLCDSNKRVQQSACSAIATLEEAAGYDLVMPMLHPILSAFANAFQTYQARNLLILYDALSTLCDTIGSSLNHPEILALLLPPLIQKWNIVEDGDKALVPLMECLTSVCSAVGDGFAPMAPPICQRALRVLEAAMLAAAAAETVAGAPPPDKEFLVCSLDVLSGLTEGLGQQVVPLISDSKLLGLLFECMKDSYVDVRQSAFALVGDLAKTCCHFIMPALANYVPVLVDNLIPVHVNVCNNASWALGEIAIRAGPEMAPFAPIICDRIIPMVNHTRIPRMLVENTAVTLGRLGLVCPEQVAPRLPEFARAWCLALRGIPEDIEKEHAFKGLCFMIQANPAGVNQDFSYVCDAFAMWQEPSPELRAMFLQIMNGYKSSMGDAWPPLFATFPPMLQRVLRERFGL